MTQFVPKASRNIFGADTI